MPPKKDTEGKKKRAKKDPNAPKRALSAYMIFANENRDIVRAENPGIAFGQVGKLLGQKWQELSPEKKKPFEEKAEEGRKEYEIKKAEYLKKKENGEFDE